MKRLNERGQILPLFVIVVTLILAMMALAIDISSAYAARRAYRTAADAAALAGAQDLQAAGVRAVAPALYPVARARAATLLATQLGGAESCTTTGLTAACTFAGTPYQASIRTPLAAGDCVSCDPARSVQVTVTNPTFAVSFARVFGASSWSVSSAAVAGLSFGKSYTVITLRPPKKLGSTFDVKDITIDGGSVVNVKQGDVGSNSNMDYAGSGSILNLDSGYNMYYFDPLSGPLWGSNPPGQKIPTLIADPNYVAPSMAGGPTFTDATVAPARVRASVDATCAAQAAAAPVSYGLASKPLASIYCYNPGTYNTSNPKQFRVANGEVALLRPGAYYLKSGMQVSGTLIGGFMPGASGVVLMFDECSTAQCILNGNNAQAISLNAGSKYPAGTAGTGATAAVDFSGALVQTSGPSSPTPPLLISLYVKPDSTCFVPTSAPFIEPSGCDANHNKSINIAGGGNLILEGVQYAPSDNVEIHGGSAGYGSVGQIISWTLFYSGGTHINQQGPNTQGPGLLRLDGACTTPSTPCTP